MNPRTAPSFLFVTAATCQLSRRTFAVAAEVTRPPQVLEDVRKPLTSWMKAQFVETRSGSGRASSQGDERPRGREGGDVVLSFAAAYGPGAAPAVGEGLAGISDSFPEPGEGRDLLVQVPHASESHTPRVRVTVPRR